MQSFLHHGLTHVFPRIRVGVRENSVHGFFDDLVEHVLVGVFLDAVLDGLVVNADGELHDMFHDYLPSFSISLILSFKSPGISPLCQTVNASQTLLRPAQSSLARVWNNALARSAQSLTA